MKKKIFLVMLGLVFVFKVEAQSQRMKGKIIYENDTVDVIFKIPINIYGEINFRNLRNKIKYYDATGKKQTLTPNQVREVRFEHKSQYEDVRLFSKSLKNIGDENEDDIYVSDSVGNSKVQFVELVINGRLKLFRAFSSFSFFSMPVLYMNNEALAYAGMSGEKYLFQKNNGELTNVAFLNFRKDMTEYFSDCPELVQKIEDKEFIHSDMVSIVTYYNSSCNKDTIYYDSKNTKVCPVSSDYHYYEIIVRDENDSNKVNVNTYFKSGKPRSTQFYSDYKRKHNDGLLTEYYENGQLKKKIDFKEGNFHRELLTYWEDGTPKRIERYEHGELVEGNCFNKDRMFIEYYEYETLPEFPGELPGLMQYVDNELKYPRALKSQGIHGVVHVNFIVNENGYVSDVVVVQSEHKEFSEEAIRIVKNMPKWKPGMQDGEKASISYNLPINFRLKNK